MHKIIKILHESLDKIKKYILKNKITVSTPWDKKIKVKKSSENQLG
jgi:hypothetical protein